MTTYNDHERNAESRSPEFPQSREIERSKISDAASALAASKSGESGENGNLTPLSPLLPAPSGEQNIPEDNAAFLAEVFASAGEHETVAVCSKPGDPTSGAWLALDAKTVDQSCPPSSNNYFNCSTLRRNSDGDLKATSEQVARFHVLMLDDVGTKVSLDAVAGLEPSYAIETSPCNFQYGYVLDTPLESLGEIAALQDAVADAELCDKGAKGSTRWARLPYATNGKEKYRDDDGRPYRCTLSYWSGRRFSLNEIYEGFKLGTKPRVDAAISKRKRILRARPTDISHEVFQPKLDENPVITALKTRGLYRGETKSGVHEIICPWIEQHTDQVETGTAYFEPTEKYPMGGFKCHHSHGDNLGISDLVSHLDINPQEARNRPVIRYEAGAIDQVVKACEYELSRVGNVFQAGGVIVILRETEESNDVRMEPASTAELTLALAAACSFLAYNRKEREWRPCDPPERVLRTLLGASRYVYLPNLRGIARQPYYRPGQGSLVTIAGYDAISGIYGWFDEDAVKLGPLTREGALFALAKLEELIEEFDFETPTDRAATLSAIFTATVRPYLPVAPAFLTTAPESGVGKSYLNSVIVPFAGGEPARASFPPTADEATKSVLALLLSSPSCIEYDDMVCNFKPHAILNRALTSEKITDRILSVSKTATVSTKTFIIGSGINITPERDMNRRVITIRLASRPDNRIGRNFKRKPAEFVRGHRMEMISHVLTIIEAWKAAGEPKSDIRSIASYNGEWSEICRHPLVWLGQPDPAQSLFDQVEDDVDGEMLGVLLQEWYAAFGSTPITVRKVVEKGFTNTSSRLFALLDELPIQDSGRISNNKLGWYISLRAKRIVGGLRFVEGRADGRRAWLVEKVAKVVPPVTASPTAPLSPLSPHGAPDGDGDRDG